MCEAGEGVSLPVRAEWFEISANAEQRGTKLSSWFVLLWARGEVGEVVLETQQTSDRVKLLIKIL